MSAPTQSPDQKLGDDSIKTDNIEDHAMKYFDENMEM